MNDCTEDNILRIRIDNNPQDDGIFKHETDDDNHRNPICTALVERVNHV